VELDSFTFIAPEIRERALRHLARLSGNPDTALDELTAQLSTAVSRAQFDYFKDGVAVNGEEEADSVQFATGYTTPAGEEITARCDINKRPGYQKWFGIRFQVPPRPGYILGDLCFPNWHDGPRFLEEVANMANKEEKWTYANYQSRQKHPILRSYLAKTYERVKQQGKLVREGSRVLFNTGLIDEYFKEIYVVCDEDPGNPAVLLNARPVLENDRIVLEEFKNRKPAMASFFDTLADVIFDPAREVVTNDVHIIKENIERIPAEYRSMRPSLLFALFQSAVEFARVMARRNYKLVVPQFYAGQIQFLMPIYLSGKFSGAPDCALALERIHDCYRGNTILTLDMAYQNARLIAKPDPTWLNPETITTEEDR